MEIQDQQAQDQAVEIVDEKTIPLRKPVKIGDITFDKLDLREPTAGELEKASNATTQIGVVISLISLVARIPRGAAEKLCQRDLREASDFLGSFSGDSLAIGDTSPQS